MVLLRASVSLSERRERNFPVLFICKLLLSQFPYKLGPFGQNKPRFSILIHRIIQCPELGGTEKFPNSALTVNSRTSSNAGPRSVVPPFWQCKCSQVTSNNTPPFNAYLSLPFSPLVTYVQSALLGMDSEMLEFSFPMSQHPNFK